MHCLIILEKVGRRPKATFEEYNSDKEYLFKKYRQFTPDQNHGAMLFNEGGGVLSKGVRSRKIKPILG